MIGITATFVIIIITIIEVHSKLYGKQRKVYEIYERTNFWVVSSMQRRTYTADR